MRTKPQVKSMDIISYDLYYTVIKNTNDKEIVIDDEYENDKINFDDFITPNHYNGRKNNDVMLRYGKMRSQINRFEQIIPYK